MQVWLLIDGNKEGPFHDFEVRSKIDHDNLAPDVMAWHEGMAQWKQLGELDLFSDSFSERTKNLENSTPQVVDKDNVESYLKQLNDEEGSEDNKLQVPQRKFTPEGMPVYTLKDGQLGIFLGRRLVARIFDYLILFQLTFFFLIISGQNPLSFLQNINSVFLLCLTWFMVENFTTHIFGSTIGKAILGMRVESHTGENLSLIRSSIRTFVAILIFMGSIDPIFGLITLGLCLFFKSKRGTLPWDIYGASSIRALPLTKGRVAALISLFVTLAILTSAVTPESLATEMQEQAQEMLNKLKNQ